MTALYYLMRMAETILYMENDENLIIELNEDLTALKKDGLHRLLVR